MKLAEALLLRADLQKKIASLKDRLVRTVMVQEGDRPPEEPAELLKQTDAAAGQLQSLICRINEANLKHTASEGRTLTDLLAERDTCLMRHKILIEVAQTAIRPAERHSPREIRWVPTVDVVAINRQADELGSYIRKLNGQIQAANRQIEMEV